MDSWFQGWGSKASNTADCFYVRHRENYIALITLYVDDLLSACSSVDALEEIKRKISHNFDIKDIREAREWFGFEI